MVAYTTAGTRDEVVLRMTDGARHPDVGFKALQRHHNWVGTTEGRGTAVQFGVSCQNRAHGLGTGDQTKRGDIRSIGTLDVIFCELIANGICVFRPTQYVDTFTMVDPKPFRILPLANYCKSRSTGSVNDFAWAGIDHSTFLRATCCICKRTGSGDIILSVRGEPRSEIIIV